MSVATARACSGVMPSLDAGRAGFGSSPVPTALPVMVSTVALAARCKGRRAIAVLNKEDLTAAPGVFDQTLLEGCFDRVVTLSATEPAARDTLAQAVDSLMGTAGLDPNAGALCSQRQLAAAVAARDALAGARQARADGFDLDAVGVCLDDALEALCRLTGEDAGEAVIDQVFSRFCVGKYPRGHGIKRA